MHQHSVGQGITLGEAQPLNNTPTTDGACDMYNKWLFSEVSHQKKVQESCLLRWPGKAEIPVLVSLWLNSGTRCVVLGSLPSLEDTRVVEPRSRDLVQACPKVQHLIWDSSFQCIQLLASHSALSRE